MIQEIKFKGTVTEMFTVMNSSRQYGTRYKSQRIKILPLDYDAPCNGMVAHLYDAHVGKLKVGDTAEFSIFFELCESKTTKNNFFNSAIITDFKKI